MPYTWKFLVDGGAVPHYSGGSNSDFIYAWRETNDYNGYELIKRNISTGEITVRDDSYLYPDYGNAFLEYSDPSSADWGTGMLSISLTGPYLMLTTSDGFGLGPYNSSITVFNKSDLSVAEQVITGTNTTLKRRGGNAVMSADGTFYVRVNDRRLTGVNYDSSIIEIFKYNGGVSPVYNYFDLNDLGIVNWAETAAFDPDDKLWIIGTARTLNAAATITGNSTLYKFSVNPTICALTLDDSWTIPDYALRTGVEWDTFFHYQAMTYNTDLDEMYFWCGLKTGGDDPMWFAKWHPDTETLDAFVERPDLDNMNDVDQDSDADKIGWWNRTKFIDWPGTNGGIASFNIFNTDTETSVDYLTDTLWDNAALGGDTFWQIRPGNNIFLNSAVNRILVMGGVNEYNNDGGQQDLLFSLPSSPRTSVRWF